MKPGQPGHTGALQARRSAWTSLYRIGGIAALGIVALIPIQAIVYVLWPPPITVVDYFTIFQTNALLGLLDLDLRLIVDQLLIAAVLLGMYAALRQTDESVMLIGTVVGLVGAVQFIVSREATLSMLSLSQQYAVAGSEPERAPLIAAGQTLLTVYNGTSFSVGYFLSARDVDLIVMATHAHGSHSILALTSVAHQVLAESPAPVLMVPPDGQRMHGIQRLLVPVDGSPGGSLALAAAAWLARRTGASIALLDVVVPVPVDAFADMPALSLGAYVDPVWEELAVRAARIYVNSLEQRLTNVGLVCEAHVATGDVAAEIIRTSDNLDADVVVMTTHSMAWPGQAYLGSVADGVFARCGRPVLLLRREPPAGETALASVTGAAIQTPV